MPRPIPDVKRALAALRHRHGLDRDTVAAMAFERSRQHKIPLTRAFTDVVAEVAAPSFGDAMSTGRCVICHAADAAVQVVDLAGVYKSVMVCEACIRLDPAELAVLIQQRLDESADA